MSPLFLSIAGCPIEESFLPPKTELAMIEGLLAHPQIDPNLGFSRWGDTPEGCFTRKSPLMAALIRLLGAKKELLSNGGRADKVQEWKEATGVVQCLLEHKNIDMEFGRHTRASPGSIQGKCKVDEFRALVRPTERPTLTRFCGKDSSSA